MQKRNLIALAKKFGFENAWTAELAGTSTSSFSRMHEHSHLSVTANEMIVKLSELYEVGLNTFEEDRKSFLTWLNADLIALNFHKPIHLIGSQAGIRIVTELLLTMESSIYCS